MTELSYRNFGLLIAYVIPGLVIIAAMGHFSETVRSWLVTDAGSGPTVAGFLYLSLAAIAAGVTVSAMRWAVIDTIHRLTGLPNPRWDFSAYAAKAAAFDAVVEDHYRYYQYYSNMVVAVAILYASHLVAGDVIAGEPMLAGFFIVIEAFFFVGSRDALRKYYVRGTAILGVERETVESARTVLQHRVRRRDAEAGTSQARRGSRRRPK